RLHVDLVRPAEAIEVVDVERAEVDLQRVEELRQVDAVRLGALAIDVRVDLRHAHLEAGEESRQLLLLTAVIHRALHLRVELLEAGAVAVLDVELEAADGAEALDGRRRKDG